MSYKHKLIAVLLWISLGWNSLSTQAESIVPTIILDRAIHFTALDGNDLLADAGTYTVQPTDNANLRLLPQTEQPAIEIQAETTTHEEPISAPTALLIAEEGQEDEIHLMLMLPDGQAFDAVGTLSGTRSRATSFRPLNRRQMQSAMTQRRPLTTVVTPSPIIKVPSAVTIAKPAPGPSKKPTQPVASIAGGSKAIPNVRLIQGRSKPEGPLTWSYLRMHDPETVLSLIKGVQAGVRDRRTLTGLASVKSLQKLLQTRYPDTFTVKPKSINSTGQAEGQISTRGVSPYIRQLDGVQTQVQSSAIPSTSPSIPGGILPSPHTQGNGWDDLFTVPGGGITDPSTSTQPKPPGGSLLDPGRAARVVLQVDYTPEQLNLGSLYKEQTTRAILQVTAPVDGKVTASIPTASTPFKIVKVRALSGRLIYQPLTIRNKLEQVAREQETAQVTNPPFSIAAKSGQTVEITVEFAPQFEPFGNRGTFVGNHAATLNVEGDLWKAIIPISGRFLGVNVGVMAIPDTTDVVAYCPNTFPAGFTFLNATNRPQQVTLTTYSAPHNVYLNAVCTNSFFVCYQWEDRPFSFPLAPGERKHMDIPLRCDYSYEEGPVTVTYAYEGTKRQATFNLRPYPTMMKWTGSHTIPFPDPEASPWESCYFNWSVLMTPDGAFATRADFGRFKKESVREKQNADLDHWAGIQVKLRDMNLGQIWSSYRGFATIDDTPNRYSTGGKEITYTTFEPSYVDPDWQGVLPQIQASYTDLTRQGPIVRLACGESGIDGNPNNPF